MNIVEVAYFINHKCTIQRIYKLILLMVSLMILGYFSGEPRNSPSIFMTLLIYYQSRRLIKKRHLVFLGKDVI